MRIATSLLILCCASAAAQTSVPPDIADCHKLDKGPRLECYDRVTGYTAKQDAAVSGAQVERGEDHKPATGLLAELWGFDKPGSDNLFEIKQYHQNYIVAYDTRPFNGTPTTTSGIVYDDQPSTDPRGLKFQISGKMRVLGTHDNYASLWLAYSQLSWWQVFDGSNSRPFRETDFQPEAIVSLRPELFTGEQTGDLAWRLLNFGFIHQSNGQSGNASRSWNRVYVEAGFERDFSKDNNLAILARAWARLGESDDENPGITRYIGNAQLQALWRFGDNYVTATLRGNASTGKGSAQVSWAVPIVKKEDANLFPLKLYLQYFTGYGESLLDYNFRQQSLGIGFALNDRR